MKKIYYNGDFITFENNKIEAIFIDNGIIKKIGNKEEIFKYQDENTELINLEGKTIMPSFIDSHSHFTGVATNLLKADLTNCKSFKEIQIALQEFKQQNNIPDNIWISATGYDNNNLEEKKHPTKQIIDKVLPNNPVVLEHKSGHVGVFNTKGLEILNINLSTKEISGGVIEKIDGNLTGYMEENAFIENLKNIPTPNISELISAYEKAQKKYLSYGITTIQDGMAYPSMIPLYENLINNNKLKLDLTVYIEIQSRDIFFKHLKNSIGKYDNNLKLGGYKIFLDGTPQGRTAWMRAPYTGNQQYYGYNTMQDSEVENAIKIAINTNMQILAHCNGDKAAEQFINNIKKYKNEIENIRPVMIHAQLLGIDQIEEVKKYNIIPSFFVAHVFYWGDVHIENFGFKRASEISPANTALKHNVLFTFHQDSPVLEPDMFRTIWCAITRKTKSGKVLGNNEKISVLDAIKAVTINSAYQYFEENEKGSISEGKLANLIIIDKNPLKIDVNDIKNIKILETIKNGITLFKQDP